MTKRETARLLALFYGAVLAVMLLGRTFCFVYDSIGRASGAVREQTFTLSSDGVALSGIEWADGEAYTIHEDPQLLLPPSGRIVSVRMEMTCSKDPGEIMLFYARQGEDFSKQNCVYPRQVAEGVYEFTLPSFGVEVARVDPTSRSGVVLGEFSLTVNAPRGALSYYAMSGAQVFNYVVYTGMAAAFAAWVWANFGRQILARWRAPLERALHLKKRGT